METSTQTSVPAIPCPLPGMDEEMSRALIHLHTKGFRPAVVADVGAGRGYWSIVASGLFRQARFFMFDPIRANGIELDRICDERPERFRSAPIAMGDTPGESVIYVCSDTDGSSMLPYTEDHGLPEQRVEVQTLDGLVEWGRLDQPDLVKIDVQGFEGRVIAGGHKTLAAAEVVIAEVNLFRFQPGCPVMHEVVAQMGELGFRVFDIAGTLRRPFEDDLGQMDLVFVRDGSALIASDRWA